ncbi:putative survival protein SurE [Dioscorea sansibarensis]
MEATAIPAVLVTNDDGINADGLRILVQVLVSTGRYHVLVCALASDFGVLACLWLERDHSGVSHGITWCHALCVKLLKLKGP